MNEESQKKACRKCKIAKDLSEFHKDKKKKFGRRNSCKECIKSFGVEYRERNKEAIQEKKRKDYLKDPEKVISRASRHQKEKPEMARARKSAWRDKHRERVNAEKREKYHTKMKFDPRDKVESSARGMLRRVLKLAKKEKTGKTFEVLGYSYDQFRDHMESLFEEGMTWDNNGEWHLDHIVPVSELLNLGIDCPKVINQLKNLRPVWAFDNLSRNYRFDLAPCGYGVSHKTIVRH